MILAGDVAIASGDRFTFDGFPPRTRLVPWSINLEGAVSEAWETPAWGTSNSRDWRESFSPFKLGPVCLANNHIHDLVDGVTKTQSSLASAGLDWYGAGMDSTAAKRPARCRSGDQEYVLLGFGWPVIGCVPALAARPGVNALDGLSALQQLRSALRDAKDARVVIVMHGNYEFERYPQPAHRDLALAMIDSGAYAVVGHHPHIVGPVERYKGRTIAYSVGNWAFSFARFFGGRLRFPVASFDQIALELGDSGDLIHHALFSPPVTVRYQSTENVQSESLSLRPSFEGMDSRAYIEWFKQNRVKRKGLPIYRNIEGSLSNQARDAWVSVRQVAIDAAARAGFKPMRPSSK